MEVRNVQSTSFGMAYNGIVAPQLETRARALNKLTTPALVSLNESMKQATEALKSTVYAHLSTRINDKGELYNFISYYLPKLDDNCKLITHSIDKTTSDNMDEAIKETLNLDKECTDLYNALKPFATGSK